MRQPIVPGSTVTRRRLRRWVKAEAKTKYGPVITQQRQDVAQARAYKRDVGNYYTDYLNQLEQQNRNVQQIGAQAQGAIQNLQAGVTGLAGADLRGIAGPAAADAAARGTTAAPDVAQMASNAAATRQALVGSFAAEQAARNAATQTYASNRAHVVAPGQRLGALAIAQGRIGQARSKLGETRAERGAFKVQRRSEIRAEELKNVLAQQALGLDIAKAKADIRAGRPGAQAKGESAKAMAREGAKHGYSYKQWKALGSAGRNQVIEAASKGKGADTVYTSGAFAGYTKSQINGMSFDERQRLIRRYHNTGGDDGKGGKGPTLTPGQAGAGMTQVVHLKSLVAKAKSGAPFVTGHARQRPLSRYAAEAKAREFMGPGLKSPALARAAADAVFDGHISAFTAKRLRAAGYNVREVAAALGVPTHAQYVKTLPGSNTVAYGKAPPQPQGHY